jgi:hypothetical protein
VYLFFQCSSYCAAHLVKSIYFYFQISVVCYYNGVSQTYRIIYLFNYVIIYHYFSPQIRLSFHSHCLCLICWNILIIFICILFSAFSALRSSSSVLAMIICSSASKIVLSTSISDELFTELEWIVHYIYEHLNETAWHLCGLIYCSVLIEHNN